ncbi:hypothetical protein BD626DRAFT_483824 [Schizophyllum amplum]|uniref:Uncharacterized protein n=1 Tax=Schizophyllum amplum TaxID=97359 RepID=A0A550CPR5_9AGAR|nr:hypothetical protein BD626DRAFT_483824 [Auriculariopsis ampla]
MATSLPASAHLLRADKSSPTPIPRPNINYRQDGVAAQTTSTYNYWWPYPPGGVYATTSTTVLPAAPIPATMSMLPGADATTTPDIQSIWDLTPSGDLSASDSSATPDAMTTAADAGPSIISLTALPPATTSSPPNTSPKKLDRDASANLVKYIVPVCVVVGVILGSLTVWFVYGCLRTRRTRLGHGHERRRRNNERLEAGTEYRYIRSEGDDEEKALPAPPGHDPDEKDFMLSEEHATADLATLSRGNTHQTLDDDDEKPAAGSFRWPSVPFTLLNKKSVKSVSRAKSMLSIAETDVMSLLSHGEDTPSKHDRLAANILRADTSTPKRRAAHARATSDLRLEDLGIDPARPKLRAKRPVGARTQTAISGVSTIKSSYPETPILDGPATGVNRANTVYSTYTVATKFTDGGDDGVSRANTVKSTYTNVSRANTVKSAYSTASAQRGGGFRIMVESPPTAASLFGQVTPLPTPSKILSSLFGSQEGEEEDRYTPLPERSRSRSASPVKSRGGRARRSRNASPEKVAEGAAGEEGGGMPSVLSRPTHGALDILPQSPPLVSSPFLCFETPAARGGGFGWPDARQTTMGSPEIDIASPKPDRGRGR